MDIWLRWSLERLIITAEVNLNADLAGLLLLDLVCVCIASEVLFKRDQSLFDLLPIPAGVSHVLGLKPGEKNFELLRKRYIFSSRLLYDLNERVQANANPSAIVCDIRPGDNTGLCIMFILIYRSYCLFKIKWELCHICHKITPFRDIAQVFFASACAS